MRFDADYRERVILDDGAELTLRLLRADDREQLRTGFLRLSSESRYRRFLTVKNQLSAAELDYLTAVDDRDHFAVGALHEIAGGEEGVALARCVRFPAEPTVAEMAIAVIDDWQKRGLGTMLFVRALAAARERGIKRIRSEVLAGNAAIRALVDDLHLEVDTRVDGEVIAAEFAIPDDPSGAARRDHFGYRLLTMAAEGVVELRRIIPAWLGGDEDE